MMKLERSHYLHLIDLALAEDVHTGDVTSNATVDADKKASARIIAKQEGVICGGQVVESVFQRLDPDCIVNRLVDDGKSVGKGALLFTIDGHVRSILAAERTALNFLGNLSGVATETHMYVQAVAGTRAKVYDTRKTLPGWRALQKYAVRAGGGENHRIGLWDAVLIKENHIHAAGGVTAAIKKVRQFSQKHEFLAVEAEDLRQFQEALDAEPDIILLDNMSYEDMATAVKMRDEQRPRVQLEATGNVSHLTIREIARLGVDRISVGSLTHSIKSFDVSLLLD